jgi:hypothetical protein
MKLTTLLAAGAALCLAAPTAIASPPRGSMQVDGATYSSRTQAPRLIQATARGHTCMARSAAAVGYWTAKTVAEAKLGALRECAVRTPKGMNCVIASCN